MDALFLEVKARLAQGEKADPAPAKDLARRFAQI
jgi:hypothetical protein